MTAGVCVAPANGGRAIGAWWRHTVRALFCAAFFIAMSPDANGQASTGAESSAAKAQEHAEEFSGSFSESIPIEVPPFHGIEPKLALSYDSGRRNGMAGVGWKLQGLSEIVRTSPRLGAPRFDAADLYLLDGEELIACTAGMPSPSCNTGGNYATRVESYLRIKRTASPNIWEVWSRDGTKLTYKPINTWGPAPGTGNLGNFYRWLLASVTDTHGNTVIYSYTGCTTSECYPYQIAYTGALIQFGYEPRPDLITYSTGSTLGQSPWVLESIDVRAAGQRARAYQLIYALGSATARLRLFSVQQFGKDATVDANGTVTGGTALPATTFNYSDTTNGFAPTAWARNQRSSYIALLGDFDGDGRTDVLRPRTNSTCFFDVDKSSGSAFSLQAWAISPASGCYPIASNAGTWFAEDFNGDGKTDIAATNGGNFIVYLSTGTSFSRATWAIPTPGILSEIQWVTGDFNGDAKTDLATYEIKTTPNPDPDGDDTTACVGRRFISTGTAFTVSALAVPFCEQEVGGHRKKGPFWAGDFNGDGKTDLLFTAYVWNYPPRGEDPYVNASDYMVALSTGSSFAGLATWLGFGRTGFPPTGDVGDGNWLRPMSTATAAPISCASAPPSRPISPRATGSPHGAPASRCRPLAARAPASGAPAISTATAPLSWPRFRPEQQRGRRSPPRCSIGMETGS